MLRRRARRVNRDAARVPRAGSAARTLPAWTAGRRLVPARRLRDRRVPGRARADGHGRRPAVDPADLVDVGRQAGLDRAAQGQLDRQRLPAGLHPRRCPWPAAWPTCGARAGCSWAPLVVFIVGSALAGTRPDPRPAHRGARSSRRVGGGVLVPVGTAAAAHLFEGHARARALGVIGALTFLGMAAGPFLGAAILGVGPPRGRARPAPGSPTAPLADRPRPGLALGLLRQRPDRAHRAGPGLGRLRRLGDADAGAVRVDLAGAVLFGDRARGRARWRSTLIGVDRLAGTAWIRRPSRSARCGRHRRRRRGRRRPRPPASADPFLDPRLFRSLAVQLRRPRLAADRLCLRDRDHRWGGLRRPGPVWRPERPAARAGLARRGDGRRRARSGFARPASCRSGW